VLEIRNVPTELILFAIQQWTPCNLYVKKRGGGNNTNTFLKAISVWLILKNETSSGTIKNYRQQMFDLANKCKMSVRSLDNYLRWLRKEDLVHVEGKNLFMHDYKTLKKYGINIKEREKNICYDTSKNATLAEILITVGIRLMKQRWMRYYWRKVNKNPDALSELRNQLIAHGADDSMLDNPEYFRQRHLDLLLKTYKEEEPGQESFYFLHTYLEANPDLNCRQDTYASKLGLAAAMSFCHIKFRLQKKGLIQVRKDHIESEYRARKDEKMFHHRYVRKTKQTIWFRPDQITINRAIYAQKKAA
jgi:hypothetical protein